MHNDEGSHESIGATEAACKSSASVASISVAMLAVALLELPSLPSAAASDKPSDESSLVSFTEVIHAKQKVLEHP